MIQSTGNFFVITSYVMSALIKCYQFPRLQNQQNCTYHSLYYQRQYNLQSHAAQNNGKLCSFIYFSMFYSFSCLSSSFSFFPLLFQPRFLIPFFILFCLPLPSYPDRIPCLHLNPFCALNLEGL